MVNALKRFWEGVTPYHLLVFLGCWLGGAFDGMDSTLYAVVQYDAIGEVTGFFDKASISQVGAWVMSVFLIGWTLGGVCFGVIGDRFGRVTAMVISIALYALFTGLAGFAQTPEQLALCRFLVGFGIGGELVTIGTMLSETWPERSRAWAVGSLITSYQMGVYMAGLLSTWVYENASTMLNVHSLLMDFAPWRIVFFVGALPALLAILLRLRLEEPEKWILAKSQAVSPSESILQSAEHSLTMTTQPAQQWFHVFWEKLAPLFTPAHFRDVMVGGTIFGGLLIGYWASLSWIPTWIQSLLGEQGTGAEKAIATQFHGIAAVFGCLIAGVLADWIGRRWTIILAYGFSFAASCLLFLTNDTFSELIYWEEALLGFFVGIGQAIMYIYLPELFPTSIRATATGFCLNIGRTVTAVAVLFVGVLTTQVFESYAGALMTFSGAYLIALLGGIFARETKGVQLPD